MTRLRPPAANVTGMSESSIGRAESHPRRRWVGRRRKVAPAAIDAAPTVDSRSRGRRGILALMERPLTVAFVATVGVLGALIIAVALGSITTLLLQIALALFIALGLDPIVRSLERRGLKRGAGIGIVFGGYALVAAAFLIFILPPVVSQIAEFIQHLPQAVDDLLTSNWFAALPIDARITIAGGAETISETLTQPETLAAIGGGAQSTTSRQFSTDLRRFHHRRADAVASWRPSRASRSALCSLAPARDRAELSPRTVYVSASISSSLFGSLTLLGPEQCRRVLPLLLHRRPVCGADSTDRVHHHLRPALRLDHLPHDQIGRSLFSGPTQALILRMISYLIFIQVESDFIIVPCDDQGHLDPSGTRPHGCRWRARPCSASSACSWPSP